MEANGRDALPAEPSFRKSETPRFIGRAIVHLAAEPQVHRWNGQSVTSYQKAKLYGFTDRDGSQLNGWGNRVEI